jgi:hypothetical protein
LISSGAIPTKSGKNGQSPIDIAYSCGYSEILKILIEAESDLFH